MKHSCVILIIAGLALSACIAKEMDTVPTEDKKERFFATLEDASLRAYVDNGLHVLWNADDRISVFNRYTYNREYRFEGNDGDNSGSFIIVPDETFVVGNSLNQVYAVYPYQKETRISDDGEILLTLPDVQSYRENSFGKEANTMISVSQDNQLMFRNLCGYLTLRLYGDHISISSLSIKGNHSEPIAGRATVIAREDQAPTFTFDESATTEISIFFDTPILLGDNVGNATVFWLVVPPVTFSEGFTLTVTDSEGGQFEKRASSCMTIDRNVLYKMAALRIGQPIPGEVTGITLDKSEMTLGIGQSIVLHATVHPEDASDKTVTWASEDERIATVNKEGCITAVSEGTTFISATASGRTALCRVSVTNWKEDDPIPFADQRLKEKLLIRFDTDGDGELSYKEAAAVTSLEGAVTGIATIKAITSFDEFQFFTGITTIPEKYFSDWESLSSIVLPPSLTSVNNMAFFHCSALESVVIPEGVERIGASAFSECGALSSVILPETLTQIGSGSFLNCDNLHSLLLPDKLTIIEEYGLAQCGLTSIAIPGQISTVEDYAFSACKQLKSVTIAAGVQTIDTYAFSKCESLEAIDFGPTVSIIEQGAFRGCKNLKSVSIPAGVRIINSSVFQDCYGLVSVTLPEGLLSILAGAFINCKSLCSIVLPEGTSMIGQGAFSGCEALTELTLPSSITRIDPLAFNSCTSLQSISIPEGLTSLGKTPFKGCISLASITVSPGNPEFDSRDNCNAIIKTQSAELITGCQNTVIPRTITSIGQEAFFGCTTLTSIEIPSNVSSVGYNAFQRCSNLSSLTLSEGVESLDDGAFGFCEALTTVVIPESMAKLGASAFGSCHGLTSIQVKAVNPPKGDSTMFNYTNDCPIMVPAESVELYKADPSWGNYASRIIGM